MAVRITDLCITCDACLDGCPTKSIVSADENPTGQDIYYVNPETCTECGGGDIVPQCADGCPVDAFVWDKPTNPEKVDGEAVID